MNQIQVTTASVVLQSMNEASLLGLEKIIKETLAMFNQSLTKQLGRTAEVAQVLLQQKQPNGESLWWFTVRPTSAPRPILSMGIHTSLLREWVDAFLQTKTSVERTLDEFDQSIALEIVTVIKEEVETQWKLDNCGIHLQKNDFAGFNDSNNILELRFEAKIDQQWNPVVIHMEKDVIVDYIDATLPPVQVQEETYLSRPAIGVNMELVSNIPLTIGVELGKTKRLIKDILEFHPGTIIEIDKENGSKMDIIVNGMVFAKGEIVVLEENFGVRIDEIISKSILE